MSRTIHTYSTRWSANKNFPLIALVGREGSEDLAHTQVSPEPRRRIALIQNNNNGGYHLKNNVDSGKTFFAISVNTGRIYMGFEKDTPKTHTINII